MARDGTSNYERFPIKKERVDGKVRYRCRVCGIVLPKSRQTFCGPRCLRDFFMQTDWRRVREVIFARDGGRCMECNEFLTLSSCHVDHIIPISRGGDEWDLSNLELLCATCNLKKGNKSREEITASGKTREFQKAVSMRLNEVSAP